MRKKITAASLLIILIGLLALGTTAYFTAEGRTTNVVSTSAIAMRIDETGDFKPTGTEGVYDLGRKLMPSQSVGKTVQIENTGSEPFYTRVKVEIAIQNSENQPMPDDFDRYVKLNYGSGWTRGSDGWFYYQKDVAAKTETQPVFNTVLLDPTTPNEMKNAKISIIVTAQAVQAKNNPPAGADTTTVTGWPAA